MDSQPWLSKAIDDSPIVGYLFFFVLICFFVLLALIKIRIETSGDFDLRDLFRRRTIDRASQSTNEAAPLAQPPAPLWDAAQIGTYGFVGSVAYGAVLISMNWRTLGYKWRARRAMAWAIACVLLLPVWALSEMFLYLPFFVAWYYISYRPHAKYVLATYGKSYPKRDVKDARAYMWKVAAGFAVAAYMIVRYMNSVVVH